RSPLKLVVASCPLAQARWQWLIFSQIQTAKSVRCFFVAEARLRACHHAIPTGFQSMSMTAHPSFLPGRISYNQGIVRNILRDHTPGCDKSVSANRYSTDDGCVRSNCGATPDNCLFVKTSPADLRTWI